MDTKDAIKLKEKCEKEILNLLNKLKEKTDLNILSIDLEVQNIQNVGGEKHQILNKVDLRIYF